MRAVLVLFQKPTAWYGHLICLYQLLRGVKYWQVSHVELATEYGMYAYRINDVLIQADTELLGSCDVVQSFETDITEDMISHRSRYLKMKWGHFTPLSVLNGNHCVRFISYILRLDSKAKLPGDLLYELECRSQIFTVGPSRHW